MLMLRDARSDFDSGRHAFDFTPRPGSCASAEKEDGGKMEEPAVFYASEEKLLREVYTQIG